MNSLAPAREEFRPTDATRRFGWKQCVAVWLSCAVLLAVLAPWWNIFFLLPVALAISLVSSGAGLITLRLVSTGLAAACCLWALFMTIWSYPFIVIADSDLGINARDLVADYAVLSRFSIALCLVLAAAALLPWSTARLGVLVVPLVMTSGVDFRSTSPPVNSWRTILMVLGIATATELWGIGKACVSALIRRRNRRVGLDGEAIDDRSVR